MKAEKISMKWKVFGYFLGFTAVLIGILWFLQVVYLDTFYRQIKEQELKKAATYVQENMESDKVQDVIDRMAKEYDVSILITDTKGEPLYKTDEGGSQIAFWLSSSQFRYYYEKAQNSGGELDIVFETGNQNEDRMPPEQMIPSQTIEEQMLEGQMSEGQTLEEQMSEIQDPEGGKFGEEINRNPFYGNERNQIKRMMGIRLADTAQGGRVILIESLLTPVEATVNTLRTQLIYISVITLALSLVLALLLSKSISKSIAKVNESAKKLGKGEFDVVFEGKDYKEIAELSETLNKAARDLAKVEHLQRELIANVSHDLRTPLTMITAYSEVMRDIPGENTTENVQVVIEEAQRLTNLVNDMLDVSKLQSGVLKLEPQVYDLTAGVERVMERYAKLKEQDGYIIQFFHDGHVFVEADEPKIYQVLYNLINNAINYIGEDKFVQVRQILDGDRVRIEVEDTGNGIPADEMENVWERYYKIDKTHKRAITGTGLGLSIVKNILKLHEAEFGVESQEGKGSIFWFALKIYRES